MSENRTEHEPTIEKKGIDDLAQQLIKTIKNGKGGSLSSDLRNELLSLLASQESLDVSEEKSEPKLVAKIVDVWDKEPDYKGYQKNEKFRERVDKIVLGIIKDLQFIHVHGKGPNQTNDFSSYAVWSKETMSFKDLNEKVTGVLREKMPQAIRPETAEFLKAGFRTMTIFDIPNSDGQQLVTYTVDTLSTTDRSNRETDGYAQLFFSIKKDNPQFQLLKVGKINPREFINAVLHASLVLSPTAEHLLEICDGGTKYKSVLIVDYSAMAIENFPSLSEDQDSDEELPEPVIENFFDEKDFFNGLKGKVKVNWGTQKLENIFGLYDPDNTGTRTEFADFIKTGSI